MSAVQILFLLGLSAVLLAVVGFTAIVFVSALRLDGGSHLTWGFLRRFARSPRERAELNRWAFYLHRVSGFAIFAFLSLHIIDVSTYALSHALYDDLHRLYGTPPMRVFESGLLFAILFHTFNGLRLVAVDVADLGLDAARRTLLVAVLLAIVLSGAGSAVIMAPVLR